MKFVRMLGMGLLYFCVATVLAQGVVLAMLWWKGAFSDDRMTAMFAALHGIHPETAGADAAAKAKEDSNHEQPSLEDISKKRLLASLDLSLRETTLDKSLIDLRTLEQQVATDFERLKVLKEGMDKKLDDVKTAVMDEALQELLQTLMAISPKQAKEQILKMLTTTDGSDAKVMNDVVRMLKAMPLDKRKKILGEFKTAPESEKLAKILEAIRTSPLEMDLLRDSRNQLENGTKR